MKTHLQRSISDLEQTITHELLNSEKYGTIAWMDLHDLLKSEESLSVYCGCSVIEDCFHLGVCVGGRGLYRLYGATVPKQFPQYPILG